MSQVLKQELSKIYNVGYTCGVFDLFHVGHLNLLEKCKSMCTSLIVGVCDDDYVREEKCKEPVINELDRLRILNSLKCVDKAVLIDRETTNDKLLALDTFKFNVLFSGDDWKGTERYLKTEKDFQKYGDVCIVYLPYTQGISTTSLKEKINQQDRQ